MILMLGHKLESTNLFTELYLQAYIPFINQEQFSNWYFQACESVWHKLIQGWAG